MDKNKAFNATVEIVKTALEGKAPVNVDYVEQLINTTYDTLLKLYERQPSETKQ